MQSAVLPWHASVPATEVRETYSDGHPMSLKLRVSSCDTDRFSECLLLYTVVLCQSSFDELDSPVRTCIADFKIYRKVRQQTEVQSL